MRNQIFCAIVLFTLLIFGYADKGSSNRGANYNDKRGLISFSISESWILKNESNGMRFVRSKNQKERSTIVVNANPQDPMHSLENRREIGKKQIRQQGADIITDKLRSINGFSAWESVFKLRTQSVHSFYLFSDDLRVEVKLIVLTELYPNYISDLNSVVESVRAN